VNHHPNRSVGSRRASGEFIPGARSDPAPRRMPSHRATSGRHSSLPFRPSARSRVPTMPSADFCGAVREDCSTLSPAGHPADLPRSAVIPSVHRRRMYKAQPTCGWRALLLRASSPRLYHTSYPVRVPRPARSFHASFRPHLTVTPLRFPCPSAPRTPGQETFTPKHDSMHGTHAPVQRRAAQRTVRCNQLLGGTCLEIIYFSRPNLRTISCISSSVSGDRLMLGRSATGVGIAGRELTINVTAG
jgi:hypothetical protein